MRPSILAGGLAILLGLGVATSAVLGPLVLGVIRFRTSPNLETQFIGGEVVSLGLVAPLLVLAGVAWLRGHRLAPALAIGPALYAVYTYLTAVAGQEYGRYPGNVERFFPLYVALVAGGAALAVLAVGDIARTPMAPPPDRLRRAVGWLLAGIGAFFALAWAAQIRQVLTGSPTTEYVEGPTLFWLIKLLDLGFVIPALLATGIGLLRRRPAAVRAAYAMSAFAACLGSAVAAMAIAMALTDDPASDPVMLAVAVPAALLLAVVTVRLFATAAGEGRTSRWVRTVSVSGPTMDTPGAHRAH